ncbi:MAG: ATP-binding cassette domain-containing protein [Flavobacteriales bacterium]|nr:ATP-binding cassette domain-containing protein [Flavobacteriales bacterium]
MIEVVNISKSFGDKQVLKNVSIPFEQGKKNLLIGASGSGKTTIAKCIVGLHQPDEGDILFEGNSLLKMDFEQKRDIRKQIGFLFQGSALFDSMTVQENVIFPLRMFSKMTEEEMVDRANFCLKRVNLENTNKLFPSELSGGMMKRVGIARAISAHPKYLFCDEPNSGLDPQTSIVIDELISEITEEFNTTTIVITHDMNSVVEIGDNIFFIYKGNMWWTGDRHEILETDNKEVVDFVYASKFLKAIRNNSKI